MPASRRTILAALALGGTALLARVATVPAEADQPSEQENTAICGECTHRIEWGGAERVTFYEVFLADPEAEDGRRLAYKGPRSSIYITVHGDQTVLVRACNSAGCSGLFPIPLTAERDFAAPPVYRSWEPLYFLHESDARASPIGVGWPTFEHRSIDVDISASRQQVCGPDPNEPWWFVGTRLIVRLSADEEFVVTNRHVVEHDDGSWTWTGDITGDHDGTMQFTTDACGEAVYASIDSNVGQYVIRPAGDGRHVGYRVEPGIPTEGCSVLSSEARVALLQFEEDVAETVNASGVRTRTVNIDHELVASLFSPLEYILGEDRQYNLASFVPTSVYVELFEGEPLALDLHAGNLRRDALSWTWRGCVMGQPDRTVRFQASWSGGTISMSVDGPARRETRLRRVSRDGTDQYLITDRQR